MMDEKDRLRFIREAHFDHLASKLRAFPPSGNSDHSDMAHLRVAISLIQGHFAGQEEDKDIHRAWVKLNRAFDDLTSGIQPEFLTAPPGNRPTRNVKEETNYAIACVAISKSKHGQKSDTRRKAAKLLGITETQLENYRKNFNRDGKGSTHAKSVYQAGMQGKLVPHTDINVIGASTEVDYPPTDDSPDAWLDCIQIN